MVYRPKIMIVQSAPNQEQHFVIIQTDHARMSGQLAKAFGNEDFAPLKPAQFVQFVAEHHDEGWVETDEKVMADPETGFPYHLTKTPISELIQTSRKSPAFNEAHHPYCGILSSMHTTGLFNGRYGMSDFIFIDKMPAEYRQPANEMLKNERVRQERLIEQLQNHPITADWVTKQNLFHNYKLLQFFDTLALYFHMTHSTLRQNSLFLNVPRGVNDDVTVTIEPVDVIAGIYQLSPFPFAGNSATFRYQGRWMTPQPSGTDLKAALMSIEATEEVVKIISK